MSDLEQVARDAYLVAATSPSDVVDDATVAGILGAARSRRRGRITGGTLLLAVAVAGVALGAFAMGRGTTPPATSPTPTAPTTDPVNYVTTLPAGITGVADVSALGEPTASGIVGAPAFYTLTPEVLAQRGPGWGYTIFGGYVCYAPVPDIAPVLALVSPDGFSFAVASLPADVCNSVPIASTGNLVLIRTTPGGDGGPMYLANVVTGTVTLIDPGVDYQIPVGHAFADGQGVAAFGNAKDGSLVVVQIDPEGGQHRVAVASEHNAFENEWFSIGDQLFYAERSAGETPLWGWPWYAMGPSDAAPRPIELKIPEGTEPGDDCERFINSDSAAPVIDCDFNADRVPATTYFVEADGTVLLTNVAHLDGNDVEATYSERAVGDVGTLDATVTYSQGRDQVVGLDSSVLEPPATGPWQVQAGAYAFAAPIVDFTQGIDTEVARPDGGTSVVAALVSPQETFIVLPMMVDGAANSAGRWLWWNQ